MTDTESSWRRPNTPLSERGSLFLGTIACFATALAGLADVLIGDPYPLWQASGAVFGIAPIRSTPRRPGLADPHPEDR